MKPDSTATSTIAQLHLAEYETLPDIVVSVPGLVRILGEHTIHNDGLMLAFPMDRRVSVAFSARRDSSVRFFAADLNERKRTNLSNLKFKREDRWANYIKAAISACLVDTTGIKGYNVSVSGDIPQGLGLGSATALQCAATRAASLAAGYDKTPADLARSIVETDRCYFDKQTRIADYIAPLAAKNHSLIRVDAYEGTVETIPSPFDGLSLLLTDSRVPRPPQDMELQLRSNDCSTGLAKMNGTTQRMLREYEIEELDEYMGVIPERIRRHCAFFIEEITRVKEAGDAAAHRDIAMFSKALNKSQAGLRNNYEISCPEIDWLVKRALEIDGVWASRMTGKGFGGCTLTILEPSAGEDYRSRLEEYERIFGFKPGALEISAGAGMITE
ncbi:MAG: galactokinase [Spirochaetales bacterium]|nr:galactokinase [Spirochaetales bacterium]